MNVKRWLLGSLVVALLGLGGCATYDDGYAHGYYNDGRYYDGSRYRSYDGWRRYDGDRGYYRYRAPDYSLGFSYRSQP